MTISINATGAIPVAFFAVVSIGVVGLYLAFAIPIFLGTSAPLIGISTVTRAGSVISAAITADTTTPLAGTWRQGSAFKVGAWNLGSLFLLSVDQSSQPGTARSRLNAKSMWDELVIHAIAQKNCPAVEMISTTPTHPELIDTVKIV